VSEVAPPAAPAAAPVEAPAPAADTSASAPQGSDVPSSDAGSAPEPPASDPWYSQFDWDGWDGDQGALTGAAPEERREELGGLLDKLNSHYTSTVSGKERQLNELMEVYTSMLDGAGDPRVQTLTSDLETARKELEELQNTHKAMAEEYKGYQAQSDEDYVNDFWDRNKDLRNDKAALSEFAKYLDDGDYGGPWNPYLAVEVMKLGEAARQVVIDAKKNGTPEQYAFKLGQAHDQIHTTEQSLKQQQQEEQAAVEAKATAAASKPRPAARITAGADRATISRPAERSISDARSIEEMRNLAANRALRVHRGGKR